MSSSSLKALSAIGCAVALLCGPAHAAGPLATSWEIAAEFNSSTNLATDLWQYGWKTAPTATLQPFSLALQGWPTNFAGWQMTTGSKALPFVAQNQDQLPSNPATDPNYPATVPAHGLVMHPGWSGELPTIRFRAPYPAYYRISGAFYVEDGTVGAGTNTTGYLVRNWTSPSPVHYQMWSGAVQNVTAPQASFTSKYVMLNTGESVDFEVGPGPNGYMAYGSTGVHAVIEVAGGFCAHNSPPCW